jgi:hypothetical protein
VRTLWPRIWLFARRHCRLLVQCRALSPPDAAASGTLRQLSLPKLPTRVRGAAQDTWCRSRDVSSRNTSQAATKPISHKTLRTPSRPTIAVVKPPAPPKRRVAGPCVRPRVRCTIARALLIRDLGINESSNPSDFRTIHAPRFRRCSRGTGGRRASPSYAPATGRHLCSAPALFKRVAAINAPQPAVWSADEARDAMPVASSRR